MNIPEYPITKKEQYYTIIAGGNGKIPYPESRIEKYLAKAAGADVVTDDPILREEFYLNAIANNGTLSLPDADIMYF